MVIERIKNINLEDLRLYPNSEGAIIKKAVADYYGIDANEVFAGNGSDEVLAFLFKTFFDDKTTIAFPDISYSFYPVFSNLFGIPSMKVPLKDDFTIDFNDYPRGVEGIIFANPNAPTGLYIEKDKIEGLLRERPDTLIAVDEAYVDFGGESCIPLIKKYDNLIVIQTLSKSRALAGQRIGFAAGSAPLIEGFARVKNSFNSYPLDMIAQIAGEAAFKDNGYFNETRERIIKTREWTKVQFKAMGINVTDSKANFIFAKIPGIKGAEALARLRQNGILVRNLKNPRISDWLRISVGTDEDMKKVVDAIKKIMAG
jgi:histidinol-phosphate aminotransferase